MSYHPTLSLAEGMSSLCPVSVQNIWYLQCNIERKRETEHALIWLSLRCPSCCSIWLFIVVNLSLCLICKLNTSYLYTEWKSRVSCKFWYYLRVQAFTSNLGMYSTAWGWGGRRMSLLLEGYDCLWPVLQKNALLLTGVPMVSPQPYAHPLYHQSRVRAWWFKWQFLGTNS